MRILVTGGAGCIGSALCRHFVRAIRAEVVVDETTCAANLEALEDLPASPRARLATTGPFDTGTHV